MTWTGEGLPKVGDYVTHRRSGKCYRVDVVHEPNALNPTGHVMYRGLRDGKRHGPGRGAPGAAFRSTFKPARVSEQMKTPRVSRGPGRVFDCGCTLPAGYAVCPIHPQEG